MSMAGPSPEEPTKAGVPIGDLLAGIYGAYGVLAALHERHRTGRGRVVRTSLLAAIVGVHAFQGTRWTVAGEVPRGMGNRHPSIAPYGLFRTADVPLQIACGSEEHWRRLSGLLGIADPRFASNPERVALAEELTIAIEKALTADTAEHWLDRFGEMGVPAGRVRALDETYAWSQTLSQGLLIDVDHPSAGKVSLPGPPLRFDDNLFAGARERHLPPPRLGEHNESIRAWLAE
jgi:crotonobetainyl-CoA:carnitine CoA-transferase CaiB-like acyl-CoA transferase